MNKCSDCQGDLEKGALLDFTNYATIAQRFAKSDNIPTNTSSVGVNEANFKDIRRVIAYRCVKCNRIFQYAQDIIITDDLNKQYKKQSLAMILLTPGIIILILLIVFVVIFLFSR